MHTVIGVEFYDPTSHEAGWAPMEEASDLDLMRCFAVGILAHEDQDKIVLAQAMSDQDGICGMFVIPMACVIDRVEFRQAADSPVFRELISDLKGRDQLGLETYGKEMAPGDGRNSLQDAYEEALDLAAYLKKALMEDAGTGG